MEINMRAKPAAEMSMLKLPYNDCYMMNQQAMHKDYDTNMSDKDLSIADDKGNEDMPPEFYAYDETFDMIKRDNLQRGIKHLTASWLCFISKSGRRKKYRKRC